MQIIKKQYAIYLIIAGDLCWNFAHCIILQKSFIILTKILKICNAKTSLSGEEKDFLHFQRNNIPNLFIFCLFSVSHE
jgi:hypothetical protein